MKSIRLLGATLLGATGVFAEQSQPIDPTPAEAKTPITAELTVNQTPEKPTPPTEPGEGGGDEGTDINGLFGIAYSPGALSGRGELNEKGSSEIDLTNNKATENKFNVGVQDKTRAKDRAWTFKSTIGLERRH